jgi:predicted transcriptional regulator
MQRNQAGESITISAIVVRPIDVERITMYDMKTSAITIRLDPDLERQLAQIAKRTGRTRSEIVRDAVKRQLALAQFQDLRRRIMPLAEARGYLTDEDVFRDVS